MLDENGCEPAPGELGELCVRGSFLAMGYYGVPDKTAESFVQNPLNCSYPELIYKTGDLVYYNERGELVYMGRKDFQIKHMATASSWARLRRRYPPAKGWRCAFACMTPSGIS